MSKEVSSAGSGGVGLFGLMFLLFLGLKLGGVINWSWWWVTAPLWGPAALVLAILVVVFIFALIGAAFSR